MTPICPPPSSPWYCVHPHSKTQQKKLSFSTAYKNSKTFHHPVPCLSWYSPGSAFFHSSCIKALRICRLTHWIKGTEYFISHLFVFSLFFSSLVVGFFYSVWFCVGTSSISFLMWHSHLYSVLVIWYLSRGNFQLGGLKSCFDSEGPLFNSQPLVFASDTHKHAHTHILMQLFCLFLPVFSLFPIFCLRRVGKPQRWYEIYSVLLSIGTVSRLSQCASTDGRFPSMGFESFHSAFDLFKWVNI
jgi:hypothetical protein